MDFANRSNRPAQQPQQQQPVQQQEEVRSSEQAPKKKKGRGFSMSKLASMVILFGVAILVAAMLAVLIFGSKDSVTYQADLVQADKYQAVFLDSADGQVYFGKLAVYDSNTFVLTDIYYVRVENPIQPEGADQATQPNISLAKLGSELHGPEDTMYINRSTVLYWENLKNDGQVVTAITEFKANGETTPATQQQTQTPDATTQPTGTDAESDTPTDTTTTPTTP